MGCGLGPAALRGWAMAVSDTSERPGQQADWAGLALVEPSLVRPSLGAR